MTWSSLPHLLFLWGRRCEEDAATYLTGADAEDMNEGEGGSLPPSLGARAPWAMAMDDMEQPSSPVVPVGEKM
jgi:hypothetical protein